MSFGHPLLLLTLLVLPLAVAVYLWLDRRRARFAMTFTNVDVLASVVRGRSLRRYIPPALALLALAYLMPGHYLPWASFQSQWVAALALLPMAFGLMQQAPPAQRLPLPALALLAAGLALVPALQWEFGLLLFASDALLAGLVWPARLRQA